MSKMVVPKKQDFWSRINILKGKKEKEKENTVDESQKVPNSYIQSQFLMSKIDGMLKKNHLELSI